MHISAGGVQVQQIRPVVIYESVSGRVVHTHHAITFVGGTSLSDQQLKHRALELLHETAARSGRKIPSRLEALQVDPRSVEPGVEYRVDPKQRSLVAGKVIGPFTKPSGRLSNQKNAKALKGAKRGRKSKER